MNTAVINSHHYIVFLEFLVKVPLAIFYSATYCLKPMRPTLFNFPLHFGYQHAGEKASQSIATYLASQKILIITVSLDFTSLTAFSSSITHLGTSCFYYYYYYEA